MASLTSTDRASVSSVAGSKPSVHSAYGFTGPGRAGVADREFQKRMIDLGGEPASCSPEELDARLKSDVAMWAAVVKKSGLSPN